MLPKISIKYCVLSIKQSLRPNGLECFLHNTYYLIHNTQRGFAPIALIVLLLIGIGAGTILVQNGINFLPKASEDCPEGFTSEGQVGSEGITSCIKIDNSGSSSDQSETKESKNTSDQEPVNPASKEKLSACKGEECNNICAGDTVTYCDKIRGRWAIIRKSGGYYDSDKKECVFSFIEIPEKNPEKNPQCKEGSREGDVVFTSKDEAKSIDSSIKATEAIREKAKKCISSIKCDPSIEKKAQRIVSTYDDEADKCIEKTIEDTSESRCTGDKKGKIIEQSDPGTFNPYGTAIERTALKVRTEQQRKDLSIFIDEALKNSTGDIKTNLEKAKSVLTAAEESLTQCFKSGAEKDCATAYASQINAVISSRTALAEAIANGAQGVKVKTAIVSPTQVGIQQILSGGKPVFAENEGGKIVFKVRCSNSPDGTGFCRANEITGGVTQDMEPKKYKAWLDTRLSAAQGTTATTQAQSIQVRTGSPTDGSGISGVPAPVIGTNYIRRPIDNSKCDASCKKDEGKQCREIINIDKAVTYDCGATSYGAFGGDNPVIEKVDNSFCSGQCGDGTFCALGKTNAYLYSCIVPPLTLTNISNNNFCIKPENCQSGFCADDGKGNKRCQDKPSSPTQPTGNGSRPPSGF